VIRARDWPLLGLVALLVSGLGCRPKAANASAMDATVAVESVVVAGDSISVTVNYRPGPDDGKGALDGFLIYAGTNDGAIGPDSVTKIPSSRTATFAWGGLAPGTYDGYVCVVALRRQLASSPTCKPWTGTIADTPPPPPIVDSTTVATALRLFAKDSTLVACYGECGDSALGVLTDGSVVMLPTSTIICGVFEFPDGKAGLGGLQRREAECEAIAAARFTATQLATSPAQTAVLIGVVHCFPTDGQDPANGKVCKDYYGLDVDPGTLGARPHWLADPASTIQVAARS